MTDDLAARAQEAIERAAQHLYEHRTGNPTHHHSPGNATGAFSCPQEDK